MEFSVLQGYKKGRKDPEWLQNEPILPFGDEIYIRQFWRLDSERSMGQVPGRIPVSRIEDRAEKLGLGYASTELFVDVIQRLDNHFLDHVAEKMKEAAK